MTKPALITLFLTVALLLGCSEAFAQRRIERAGILNSPKGFGVSLGISQDDRGIYNTVSITADMEGILDGTEEYPGAKITWLHENVLKRGKIRDDVDYAFFWGGGFSAGFVKDHGAANRNHGIMAGMATGVGVVFIFSGRLDISASFSGELGLQLRKDENYGTMDLSWYENGVLKAFIPQITLYYRF